MNIYRTVADAILAKDDDEDSFTKRMRLFAERVEMRTGDVDEDGMGVGLIGTADACIVLNYRKSDGVILGMALAQGAMFLPMLEDFIGNKEDISLIIESEGVTPLNRPR